MLELPEVLELPEAPELPVEACACPGAETANQPASTAVKPVAEAVVSRVSFRTRFRPSSRARSRSEVVTPHREPGEVLQPGAIILRNS